jgi:hypothetical protein
MMKCFFEFETIGRVISPRAEKAVLGRFIWIAGTDKTSYCSQEKIVFKATYSKTHMVTLFTKK